MSSLYRCIYMYMDMVYENKDDWLKNATGKRLSVEKPVNSDKR